MIDFFNALSDLIKSDLVRGNKGVILLIIIFIVVLSCFGTWIFCTKVFLQIKLNQVAEKESKFVSMQEEIEELKKKNDELVEQLRKYSFEKALDYQGTTAFEDKALEKFKRQEN